MKEKIVNYIISNLDRYSIYANHKLLIEINMFSGFLSNFHNKEHRNFLDMYQSNKVDKVEKDVINYFQEAYLRIK